MKSFITSMPGRLISLIVMYSCFYVFIFVHVLVSLPLGAMGWPVICVCDVSWSQSTKLCFENQYTYHIFKFHLRRV